jgi:hypothetical protein
MQLDEEKVIEIITDMSFIVHYNASGHFGPHAHCEHEYCKIGRDVIENLKEVFEKACRYDEVSK